MRPKYTVALIALAINFPCHADEARPEAAPANQQQIDPNKPITLTYGELQDLIGSALANAKASGALQKVQTQMLSK